MAIAGEAGELVAEFQWLTPEESVSESMTVAQRSAIESEMADVFIYLLRLNDVLAVDLAAAAMEKLKINETRFPELGTELNQCSRSNLEAETNIRG